jgi:ribonuclease P protein subunit POP4
MMHNKTFMKGEFIGRPVHVIGHTDPSLVDTCGDIIDETKNMLVINSPRGVKRVAKDHATFTIDGMTIEGADIAFRPEDRIRKVK